MPTDATRDTAAKVCPRCTGTVFTRLRRCAACGWFIGWGS